MAECQTFGLTFDIGAASLSAAVILLTDTTCIDATLIAGSLAYIMKQGDNNQRIV